MSVNCEIESAIPSADTPPVSSVLELLERAWEGLLEACHSSTPQERYELAHLSSLRAASALIAARTTSSGWSRPRSVWELLPAIAPELTEWAIFYSISGRKRLQFGEPGASAITSREADDLVRQSEGFLELVRAMLHLPVASALPSGLAVTRRS